jgi:hypothetical protein
VQRNWLPLRDPVYFEKYALIKKLPAFWADSASVPRLLAVGSSRTHLAFDATRFGKAVGCEAFNFGTPAGGPLTSDLYLRRLFAAGFRTEFVLIEWHPAFTSASCPDYEDRWLHTYRLRGEEFETLARLGHPRQKPGPFHALDSFQTYKFALLNRYCPVLMSNRFGQLFGAISDARGYMPGLERDASIYSKLLVRTREEYAPALDDYSVGGPGLAAVQDEVRFAREHGAKPIVLLLPESRDFRSWYGVEGNAGIEAAKASLGCTVIDARDWLPDTAFTDGHHLTRAAGPQFTDRLADALREVVRKAGVK